MEMKTTLWYFKRLINKEKETLKEKHNPPNNSTKQRHKNQSYQSENR